MTLSDIIDIHRTPVATERLRTAMIPDRFRGVRFETFKPTTRAQEASLNASTAWVQRAIDGEGGMLALIGP